MRIAVLRCALVSAADADPAANSGEIELRAMLTATHTQLTLAIVRQGSSTVELLVGAGVSPIIDVPGFNHGQPADVVTSGSVGIAYRFI